MPTAQNDTDREIPMMVELVKAMNWAHQNMQSEIAKSGMEAFSINQGIVLSHIQLDTRRPSELARTMNISRQAVSVILKQLEDRNIIRLIDDPDHKLAKIVVMTEDTEIMEILTKARKTTENRLQDRIGSKNFDKLKSALALSWGPIGEQGDET